MELYSCHKAAIWVINWKKCIFIWKVPVKIVKDQAGLGPVKNMQTRKDHTRFRAIQGPIDASTSSTGNQ